MWRAGPQNKGNSPSILFPGVEDLLQYSWDEEFVQHHDFRSPQVLHMKEGDDFLVHVNKVKMLVNQLVCLEIFVQSENIVMIFLETLPLLYKYFITALECMLLKELMMEYLKAHSKQKGWSTTAARHKDVLILRQIMPHNAILL
jgi:hypothetical protein